MTFLHSRNTSAGGIAALNWRIWLLGLTLMVITGTSATAQSCLCLRCAPLSHTTHRVVSSSMHPTLQTDICAESLYLRAIDPVPPPGSVVTYAQPNNGFIPVENIRGVVDSPATLLE